MRRRPARPAGFTLIELLISVALLVLIIIIASFIFDSTIKAVGQTQGSAELSLSLQSFAETVRHDVKGLEPGGYLILGRRQQQAFGSAKDRANQRARCCRNDWMEMMLSTEQYSATDPRVIAVHSRVLYGHGLAADQRSANYSQIASDWVLVRHLVLEMPKCTVAGVQNVGAPWSGYGGGLAYSDLDEGQTWTGLYDEAGSLQAYVFPFKRAISCYATRDMKWWWYWVWRGNPIMTLDEPGDFFSYLKGSYMLSSPRYALPYCAEFAIQYAMAEDLADGSADAVRWRDPPSVGQADYSDPNFRPGQGDPLHPQATIADGRLCFGPGDRWPALLRITIHAFDPLDRVDGGRRISIISHVP